MHINVQQYTLHVRYHEILLIYVVSLIRTAELVTVGHYHWQWGLSYLLLYSE